MTSVVDIHKKKGKRPDFDEYMGRAVRGTEFTEDSIWANPYPKDLDLSFYENRIRLLIEQYPKIYDLEKLRGKKLACWCITTDKIFPLVCHVQVIMKLLREKEND